MSWRKRGSWRIESSRGPRRNVPEIPVTELDGGSQCAIARSGLFQQGITARQIVVSQRVARPTTVDCTSLRSMTMPCLKRPLSVRFVAHHAQDVDIGRLAFEDAAEKINFESSWL